MLKFLLNLTSLGSNCQTAELKSLPNRPHINMIFLAHKFEDTKERFNGFKAEHCHNIYINAALKQCHVCLQ